MKRQAQSTDRLGTEKIGKLLMEFSIPAIIMMTFNALYNIVDSIFLGQAVGEAGIAVTTLAFPIMVILMGLSALAGQGGNALAAIQLGEDRIDEVERTVGNTVLLLIIIAAIIASAGIVFIDPLLALVGTTPELYDMTKTVRADPHGRLRVPVHRHGREQLPAHRGQAHAGAGHERVRHRRVHRHELRAGHVAGLRRGGFGVRHDHRPGLRHGPGSVVSHRGKDAPFHLRLRCMKPDVRLWGTILSLGVASFIMQVANAVINTILNQTLAYYGALDPIGASGALAAIGVAGRVNGFAFMPAVGVLMGAQTLIGYNYGARKWKRVRKAYWLGVLFATIIITFFFVLIHVIPGPIVQLFGVEGDLEQFCIYALQVMTAMFPLVGFQMMSSNYFQSTGQPLKASLLSLTRQVLFLIPLLLLLPMFLPNILAITALQAVCFTYPIADVLSALTTLGFIIPEMHRLNRRAREEKVVAPQVASATENLEAGDK